MHTLYGLHDPDIPTTRADEIVHSVFQLFDKSIHENILKDEFVRLLESGGDLPDCEFDGHHGDEEWEVRLPLHRSSCAVHMSLLMAWNSDDSLRYIMLSNSMPTMTGTSRNGIILKISVFTVSAQLTCRTLQKT